MNRHRRVWALTGAIALLLLLPLFGVDGFYTLGNFRNLAIDNLPLLVAAAGMTALIVAGEIDISIGSQFVVCGTVAGLVAKAGWGMSAAVPLTLVLGAAMGAINGVLVTGARIPSIIATLATMTLGRSAIIRATGGDWIQGLPAAFQWFGIKQDAAQVAYGAAAILLFVALAWAMRSTTAGRSIYAVGCSHEAARRVGLNPPVVVFAVFVLMGVMASIAALLNFTRYPTIETNAGAGFELKVIAAVVVGGTAVTGGRGHLLGTLLGVVLLGMIGTVLTFLHVDPAWEKAIQGAIILAAVVSDTASHKKGDDD